MSTPSTTHPRQTKNHSNHKGPNKPPQTAMKPEQIPQIDYRQRTPRKYIATSVAQVRGTPPNNADASLKGKNFTSPSKRQPVNHTRKRQTTQTTNPSYHCTPINYGILHNNPTNYTRTSQPTNTHTKPMAASTTATTHITTKPAPLRKPTL